MLKSSMKFLVAALTLALQIAMMPAAPAQAAWASFQAAAVNSGYVGFIDQYPSEGTTWGFSSYKLSSTYSGNWATVQRVSDSTSQAIGFTSLGVADTSAFTSFCSGTVCYATTLYDESGNANNATCSNVLAFIATDGRLALAPQAGGNCTVPYASVFSTAKQEMFVVAAMMFQDNRYYQPGLPTYVTTGNVTTSSYTIMSLASSAGISATNQQPQQQGASGIQDSAGCLPGSGSNPGTTSFSAISTTVSLSPQPGNYSPSCTSTGDTLTFTNANFGGAIISQGASAAMGSAYWGFGLGVISLDPSPTDSVIVRNGVNTNVVSNIGEAMRQALAVWDFDTYTGTLYYDANQISGGVGSSANVTYSTNVGLNLFQAPNGTDRLQNSIFEQIVLINQTAANRTTVDSWLKTQYSITPPSTTYTTTDGFTMKPELITAYPTYANAYGDASVTDANGNVWNPQTGGYYGSSGPSLAYATNINNGGTYWRSVVAPGDSDVHITGAERSEASSSSRVTPGQSASLFFQLKWEAYTDPTGFCLQNQVHYDNNDSNTAPDIAGLTCVNNQLQLFLMNITNSGCSIWTTSPNVCQINCGSPITLTPGTTYAFEIELFWSTNHTSDTYVGYGGTNGTVLTPLCSKAGALFPNDTGAYMKSGIYRGYPWANAGIVILDEFNQLWSNTANAYAAYVTTQPALPTHP